MGMKVDIRVPVGLPVTETAEFIAGCEEAGFSGVGIHDHQHSGRDVFLTLALAAQRLRYEWIQDWIADPQSIFPGTNMPQYWQDLDAPSPFAALDANARAQIEALAAYIMSIGQ